MLNKQMHKEFMNYALEISEQYKGATLPNPHTGCIITNSNNEIIGIGSHEYYGRAHAIENAFNSIKIAPITTTAPIINNVYITVEPYPSDIGLLLKYRPTHVYIGIYNPDPTGYEKAYKLLTDNNINVTVGILNDKIRESLKYYIHYCETRSPFFTGNIAMYMNNVYRSINTDKLSIFNEEAQKDNHTLRSNCNGILIDSKTWALDNPYLNVGNNKECSNYTIFVIDNQLQFVNKYDMTESPQNIVYVCFNPEYQNAPSNASLNVLFCHDLNDLKNKMYEMNIVHCLIEGDQDTMNQFSIIMDEFIYYINFNYKNNINMDMESNKVFDEMRFNFNRNLHVINTKNFDNIVKIICKTI